MATSTHQRPAVKAQMRAVRMSASKVRLVLDQIRGQRIEQALETLAYSERLASEKIDKVLRSAVSNAEHNNDIPAGELFVSECFADKGATLKRFRPRARGRGSRIQKQTCHITVEVARLTDTELDAIRKREELKADTAKASGKKAKKTQKAGGDRASRVAKSKKAEDVVDETPQDDVEIDEIVETTEVVEDTVEQVEETTEVEETVEAKADENVDAEADADAEGEEQ